MYDALGSIALVSIDQQPPIPTRQHEITSHAGIDGVTIWDMGVRGEPVTLRCKAYALTYEAARQVYRNVKALEHANPVVINMASTAEPGVLYKVLRVNVVPGRIKRVLAGRGPWGAYYAWAEVDVEVIPIVYTPE